MTAQISSRSSPSRTLRHRKRWRRRSGVGPENTSKSQRHRKFPVTYLDSGFDSVSLVGRLVQRFNLEFRRSRRTVKYEESPSAPGEWSMKKLRCLINWCFAASLWTLFVSVAMGQDYRARIEGIVTDPSKAVISGASVT